MPAGPLEHIRIVDLTQIWAGPLATRILGDLGADVIKVEAPFARGPAGVTPAVAAVFLNGDPGERPWNRQSVFNKLNRNKRGVALDLKTERGRAILLELVADADVVIENFSARAMPSLGLDYDALQGANERLIYLTMPGYGASGPYRDWVALGPSLEPMTGLTSQMGYSDEEPRVTSVALPDAVGGVSAAAAILTALQRREETGRGAFVDLSQQEGVIAYLGEAIVEQQLTGQVAPRIGNRHRDFVPHGIYRCAGEDDWIALGVRTDEEWHALASFAAGGWAQDARFADARARRTQEDALDAAIEVWTSGFDKIELALALQQRGVAAAPVLNAPELLADEHLDARGYFTHLGGIDIEPLTYPGNPVLVDGERERDWVGAPGLGQHNTEVLSELLGLSEDEIAALYESGVIADRPPD